MCVDIIIPIYNAFEDLQLCLESIKRHTNLEKHRLILINDNSSDERIMPFLDAQKNERVIIVHNKVNKGFSNNINLGMAQSKQNDVILLNSDTIVTTNWVEKILNCAYSDRFIGTVTPLSNNATLCSVPEFCKENVLPEGMTIEYVAGIVEQCSMRRYPEITVAHGFCMFIKREVIRNIGEFDSATFGRGYGEENDFCNRAEQAGYIHVMCDDTYIFHSGTKSFVSKEKENYIREHEKILRERYPRQMLANDLHCQKNPNHFIGENIGLYLDLYNGKRNVLYLLQSDFREESGDNIGGTQFHVKQLTQKLREVMNVFVIARNHNFLQVTVYIKEKEYLFRFYIGEQSIYPMYSDRHIASVLNQILIIFKIDLVHVHHTGTTSLDIFYEASKLNIPIFLTIHDFYFVCPTIKLMEYGEEVCLGKDAPNCKACLSKCMDYEGTSDYLQLWRERHAEVLEMCKKIVAPSISAREAFLQCYPECEGKMLMIPHGVDKQNILDIDEGTLQLSMGIEWTVERLERRSCCVGVLGSVKLETDGVVQKIYVMAKDCKGKTVFIPSNPCGGMGGRTAIPFYAVLPNSMMSDGDIEICPILLSGGRYLCSNKSPYLIKNVKMDKRKRFRVAFIGGIDKDKGGKNIAQIILRGGRDVEWYVFGGIGEETLSRLQQENLIKTGYYVQEEIGTLLTYHKIDAVCLLSLVPETFSYTLSESLMNRIPVIVTEIGALASRVKTNGCGRIVGLTQTIDEVLAIIESWKARGAEYQFFCNQVKQYQHPDVEEMVREYVKLYQEEFKSDTGQVAKGNLEMYEFMYKACITFHGERNESDLNLRLKEMEEYLNSINASLTFRIVRKIAGLRLPFKKQLWALLKKI